MMWTGWGLQWIWMMLFWVAVIGLIVWIVARIAPSGTPGDDRARRILDQRYARGEIDDEEYRRRRDQLDR